MTFLYVFEISMCGANDHTKSTPLINALDLVSIDVIMPQLSEGDWSYEIASREVIQEFGSENTLQALKKNFMDISFQRFETIPDFADDFYHEARVLMGAGAMNELYSRIAMERAVKPCRKIYKLLFQS